MITNGNSSLTLLFACRCLSIQLKRNYSLLLLLSAALLPPLWPHKHNLLLLFSQVSGLPSESFLFLVTTLYGKADCLSWGRFNRTAVNTWLNILFPGCLEGSSCKRVPAGVLKKQVEHVWNIMKHPVNCTGIVYRLTPTVAADGTMLSSKPQLEETQGLIAVPVGRRWGFEGGGGWQLAELPQILSAPLRSSTPSFLLLHPGLIHPLLLNFLLLCPLLLRLLLVHPLLLHLLLILLLIHPLQLYPHSSVSTPLSSTHPSSTLLSRIPLSSDLHQTWQAYKHFFTFIISPAMSLCLSFYLRSFYKCVFQKSVK